MSTLADAKNEVQILGDDKKYGPFLLDRGLQGSWSQRSWMGKIWSHLRHHD
ncbi:hypothetical protein [Thioflexithrix psekupsensis]|uniref:hypothetical protein n=1 Tax=Thioflexithrix psekupsensis TaxID=1570016 RepID=UPI001592D534|nr:hypothetical protein [Thioflexithrix psekupsensis]